MSTLILLRHGNSLWNQKNLFTGWVDVRLSEQGVAEAKRAGEMLAESGLEPDILHTTIRRARRSVPARNSRPVASFRASRQFVEAKPLVVHRVRQRKDVARWRRAPVATCSDGAPRLTRV